MLSSNCCCGGFSSNFIDIWALSMQVGAVIVYTYVFQMLAPPSATRSHIMDSEIPGESVALTVQRIDYSSESALLHPDDTEEDSLSVPLLVPRSSAAIHMVQENIYISLESSPLLSNLKCLRELQLKQTVVVGSFCEEKKFLIRARTLPIPATEALMIICWMLTLHGRLWHGWEIVWVTQDLRTFSSHRWLPL